MYLIRMYSGFTHFLSGVHDLLRYVRAFYLLYFLEVNTGRNPGNHGHGRYFGLQYTTVKLPDHPGSVWNSDYVTPQWVWCCGEVQSINKEPVVGGSATSDDDSLYLMGRLPSGTCEETSDNVPAARGLI